jgi:hypothetical protein
MTEQLYTPPVAINANSNNINSAPVSPQGPKSDDQTLPSPSGSPVPQVLPQTQQQLPQPNTTNLPSEVKLKKIRVLRVLAIKAAAILEWDLIKFEKE